MKKFTRTNRGRATSGAIVTNPGIGGAPELRAQLIVEFSVRSLEASLGFYQALGFGLQRRTARFAVLHWGDAFLYLIEEPDRPAVDGPSIANVLVLVPNVDDVWRRAVALGVPVERPIADWAYGLRVFIVL